MACYFIILCTIVFLWLLSFGECCGAKILIMIVSSDRGDKLDFSLVHLIYLATFRLERRASILYVVVRYTSIVCFRYGLEKQVQTDQMNK